jgi:tripartite-type tricarboxylate transporter receptor subunit TctC
VPHSPRALSRPARPARAARLCATAARLPYANAVTRAAASTATLLLPALLLAVPPAPAAAQTSGQAWPTRPIRLIAPFPPAGAVDLVGRPIALRLQETLGQQILFENRPGAGGNIGAEAVAKAPADGYSLLMAAVTTHAISATLYQKLGYDLQKDLVPVSLAANSPHVLIAHPSLPVKNVQDLIVLARARPGQLSWASQGNGTLSHLEQELLRSMAKIDAVHVPYKGSAPALADLFGGQVVLLFDSVPAVLHHIRNGKLRALAVATSRRSNVLPDVPTVAESGLKGYAAENWFGMMAPAGVSKEIVTRLNGEIVKALAQPELRKRLMDIGFEPRSSTPEEMRAIIASEIALWAKVIRDSGAKIE